MTPNDPKMVFLRFLDDFESFDFFQIFLKIFFFGSTFSMILHFFTHEKTGRKKCSIGFDRKKNFFLCRFLRQRHLHEKRLKTSKKSAENIF